MENKIMVRRFWAIFFINALLLGGCFTSGYALEHTQHDGLFTMDVPEGWHWADYPQETVITYPDGKTVAMDIQSAPSNLAQAEIKKAIKKSNDILIKKGIKAHHGTLIDNKEIKLDGVYATRLDFKTSPPDPITIRYISFFYKGFAFTVTYGSRDEKMGLLMDDALATIKFK